MRVYISGPISNKRIDASSRFGFASMVIKKRGFFPVNPMSILPYKLFKDVDRERKRGEWNYYMRESVKLLAECDGIYMLDGWEDSKGAKLERQIAASLDFSIMYQSIVEANEALNLDSGDYGQGRIE